MKVMKIEGQIRIPSGCAISAVIAKDGSRMTGEKIIDSMIPMHDRSNGLGGGFAGYGIYPEYKEFYAFHIFYDDDSARVECEKMLKERFEIVKSENIPIRKIPEITDIPLIWRYFLAPLSSMLSRLQLDEKDMLRELSCRSTPGLTGPMYFLPVKIWGHLRPWDFLRPWGGFIVWRNMKLTPGRRTDGILPTRPVGGAVRIHSLCWITLLCITGRSLLMTPIAGILKCSVINVRCRPIPRLLHILRTIFLRRQGLTLEETASVIAAPFWSTIREKDPRTAQQLAYLRTVYPSLLITGPFSIILGFSGGLMALNDRLKLRSMVVAEKGEKVFIASEEAAIRKMEPNAENIYAPAGGEPVIVTVKEGAFCGCFLYHS